MPQNWKTYKLGEIADVQNGFAFKSKDLGQKGIPVIKIKNVSPPNIDLTDAQYYDGEIDSRMSKYMINEGDLLIAMTGSTVNVMSSAVGKMGRYRIETPSLLNQRVGKIKLTRGDIADYDFICHYLNRFEIHYNLALNATGSANQANISPGQIKDVDIHLPPLPEQQAIAEILSSLDDKIELNLQMNKTLEEMAMTLYKHWFVDFGPFQGGEFVESELGLIPVGWEVKKFGDLVTALSKGTTPRKSDVDGLTSIIPFIKVKDVSDNGSINEKGLELIPEIVHNKQLKRSILMHLDILFSIAGTIGRVAIVPKSLDNSNCNQALAFIRLKDLSQLSYAYYFLKSEKVQFDIFNSIVQGVQANVSLTVLKELDIIMPDRNVLENFNSQVGSLLNRIGSNLVENNTLFNLQDTLLPKLISGEIRVKDAEQLITHMT